ncbi:MAG: polyprenyl synthetase family protein [Lachnospiraceae bacterium]|nr:polyprenyl synthetase family protein [Lachnospiraceae bacterium]
MKNFSEELDKRTKWVENVIEEFLPNEDTKQKIVMEAMNYSVRAGGKRLRPLLLSEMSEMFGMDKENVKPFMAVMEYIHTYSLVHDDLPAMDNDEYRRGRKTTHKQFGEAIGILAGDALLNYAFETGINAILTFEYPKRAVAALAVIASKSGIYGMIGGQTVDIISEGKQLDKDTLDYINELKTGALIEASMMAGAILAGADEEEIFTIERAASKIGQAFQIQDDVLDVISTTKELGKPVHSDEKNCKSTYVNLMDVDKAKDEVKRLSDEAVLELKSLKRENQFLFKLIEWLINRTK